MKRMWLLSVCMLAVGLAGGWYAARWHGQPVKPTETDKAQALQEAVARDGPLDMLDWLVGDWVSADDEVTAEFSCDYTKNGSFLFRPFRIVKKNGEPFSGTQLIAWDPANETIRSWTFDSNGGFGEESWSQSGDRYTIRAKYTLPDGGIASAVHILTNIDENKCMWKSVNREIDGQFQPDVDEVVIIRKQDSNDAKGGK